MLFHVSPAGEKQSVIPLSQPTTLSPAPGLCNDGTILRLLLASSEHSPCSYRLHMYIILLDKEGGDGIIMEKEIGFVR